MPAGVSEWSRHHKLDPTECSDSFRVGLGVHDIGATRTFYLSTFKFMDASHGFYPSHPLALSESEARPRAPIAAAAAGHWQLEPHGDASGNDEVMSCHYSEPDSGSRFRVTACEPLPGCQCHGDSELGP